MNRNNDVVHKATATSALAKAGGIAGYFVAVSIPPLIATLGDGQIFSTGMIDLGVSLSGIIAYTMVTLQFVLMARIEWIEKPLGFAAIFRFHRAMSIAVTSFVFMHLVLLVWSRGDMNLILFPMASWPIQLGRVAVIALMATLAISFGRRLIPINNADWRWFHNALAWTILVSGFLHSMVLGESFEHPLFAFVWVGYFAIAILAWAYRRYVRESSQL